MPLHALNPDQYAYNGYAIPMVAVGAAIVAYGLFVLARERLSRIGSMFFFMCFAIGVYLSAAGASCASTHEGLSLFWIRISQLGSVFIPSTILLFTASFMGDAYRYRYAIASSLIFSFLFSLGVFFTDLHVTGSEQFFWGRFVHYGPLGWLFTGFFCCNMVFIIYRFLQTYRQSRTQLHKKRTKGLLIGFAGGYFGAVDFLPALGIPVYPFGYISISFFIFMSGFVILRYELADITPELAAHQILKTMPSAVIVTDLEGNIQVINRVALEMLGYKKSELLGRELTSVLPGLDGISADVQTGIPVSGHDAVWTGRTGHIYNVMVSASTLTDHHHAPAGAVYVAHDITERKKVEESLKESLSLKHATLESTDNGILVVDDKGRIRDFNEAFLRLWRIPRELMHQHDDQKALEFVTAQLSNPDQFIGKVQELYGQPEAVSFDILEFKDGRVFERYSQPQKVDGRPVSRVWSFRDVTELRKSAETIQKLNNDLKATLQAIPDLLFEFDQNGTYLSIWAQNPGLLARQKEALLNHTVAEVLSPAAAADVMESIADADRNGSSFGKIIRIDLPEGARWFELSTSKKTGTSGPVRRFIVLSRDITERKQAEEKIRQNEDFIRNILDSVDEAFIVIDRDYRIQVANATFCRQAGVTNENIRGRYCDDVQNLRYQPCYEKGEECAVQRVFETARPHSAVHSHRDRNGNVRYTETKAYPLKDASGQVMSAIETISDITEKHLLEEERLKTQKLQSIGTLAGGIAHDFNNLLQGIFGYIAMAKLTYDQKDRSFAMLGQAEEALHLAVNLTTQLLTFSRGGAPVKKLTALGPLIEKATRFALNGTRADSRLDISPDLWAADVDEGQIAQVIQNIVMNAHQAMAGTGTVVVAARNEGSVRSTLAGLSQERSFIRIDIRDTGIGIPEQNLQKIFDPYFTTKQKGNGLGLATAYSIIKNHAGAIDVSSELNKGTTFTIYLPAVAGRTVEEERPSPLTVPARGGRILLMDDEAHVRSVTCEMISALGHAVESAEHGERALELFSRAKQAGHPFDLVILDLTVKGGMGGVETLRKIREIDPAVKVVVSSGYADGAIIANYQSYGFSASLNKPYNLDTLRECINAQLQR